MLAMPAAVEPLTAIQPAAQTAGSSAPSALSADLSASTGATAARVHPRIVLRRAILNVLDGTRVTVAGALSPTLPGRLVTLQMLGRHGWFVVAHARTGRRGRFALRYTPHRLGTRRMEVHFAGDSRAAAVRRIVGRVNVYRLANASWYGGGGGLACGGTLTSYTMGVANKTLPCGTMVTLRYGGRSVRVPVVDRGPYVEGREFDLTEATKRALGFEGVGEVWSSR